MMALLYGVVSGVLLTAVVLIIVFILRLFGILRHGSEYKPGQKGSVSVLVVAGSGENQPCKQHLQSKILYSMYVYLCICACNIIA